EKISQIVGLPVVATGDVHYPHPEDWEIQRLSNSIAWNVPVDQLAERRDYEAGKAAYPTSDREVATRLLATGVSRRPVKAAIAYTQGVAYRGNVKLPKNTPVRYSGSRNALESMDLLKERIMEGIKYRQDTSPTFKEHFKANQGDYKAQHKRELDVILPRARFPDCVLVHWQVIPWVKEHGN